MILSALITILSYLSVVSCYTISYKVKRLSEEHAPSQGNPLTLGVDSFNLYTDSPRNYTIFVVLTTYAPEHNCKPCLELKDQYQVLTKSWSVSPNYQEGALYFGVVEFKDAPTVFNKLQITTAPVLLRFPPTSGPLAIKQEFDTYDLNKFGMEAEGIAEYVERMTKIQIKIVRPIDYFFYGQLVFLGLVGLAALRALSEFFLSVISNKGPWLVFTLVFVVSNTGGFMWNAIRSPPFIGQRDGRPEVFASGFQNQYQIETQVIAGLYALTSLGLVGLGWGVPALKSPALQKLFLYLCLGVFVVAYSITLRVMRDKMGGGYPFKMLF